MESGRTITILWLAYKLAVLAEEEDSNRKLFKLFLAKIGEKHGGVFILCE